MKTEERLRIACLVCGIASSILYPATDIVAGLRYPGYSFNAQAVSELFAIGAPTAQLVVRLFTLVSILIAVFGLGVFLSAGRNRALQVMAFMFAGNAANSLVLWNFFPMNMRGVAPAFTDRMHGILAINPFVLASVILGVVAFRNGFRVFSIVTIFVQLIAAAFSFAALPAFLANQPTPWFGLFERIAQYAVGIWQIALAIVLIRRFPAEAPARPSA